MGRRAEVKPVDWLLSEVAAGLRVKSKMGGSEISFRVRNNTTCWYIGYPDERRQRLKGEAWIFSVSNRKS